MMIGKNQMEKDVYNFTIVSKDAVTENIGKRKLKIVRKIIK